MKINHKYYNISNDYHKRIILLSDIHYFNKKIIPSLYELLKSIKELKPDYICISGDIVDDKNIKDQEILIKWFKDLKEICKVIIGLGNHDFYFNHTPEKSYDKKLFDSIDKIKNVYVLDNKVYSRDGINFIGVTLPSEYYDNKEDGGTLIHFMNKKYPYLSKGYNIMLIHSPYQIARINVLKELKCNKNINLILSGHMHGGLTFEFLKIILKGRGLVTPQKCLFKKYCYGNYKVYNTNIIISSGITKLSKSHKIGILSFLYKSEITIIDI